MQCHRPDDHVRSKNMQSWPYYKHVSTHWDEYGLYGTVPVMASKLPAALSVADAPFHMHQDFRDGRSFVESLHATQTKGFLVMKDNVILGEFYDNGFDADQTQLLQSSSKTYAGVIASKLIDEGKLDPNATVESYLADFKGSAIGKAKVQHVLDMTAGLLPAVDYHVPGDEAFMFEIEQGLKPGDPIGHRRAIIEAKRQNAPGEVYTYNGRARFSVCKALRRLERSEKRPEKDPDHMEAPKMGRLIPIVRARYTELRCSIVAAASSPREGQARSLT